MINFNENLRAALRLTNNIMEMIDRVKSDADREQIEDMYNEIHNKINEARRFKEEITCVKTKIYISEAFLYLAEVYISHEKINLTSDIIKENIKLKIIPSIQAIKRKVEKLSKKIIVQDVFDTFIEISKALEKEDPSQDCQYTIYTAMNEFIKKYNLK